MHGYNSTKESKVKYQAHTTLELLLLFEAVIVRPSQFHTCAPTNLRRGGRGGQGGVNIFPPFSLQLAHPEDQYPSYSKQYKILHFKQSGKTFYII